MEKITDKTFHELNAGMDQAYSTNGKQNAYKLIKAKPNGKRLCKWKTDESKILKWIYKHRLD
jgi:hypothetical protein